MIYAIQNWIFIFFIYSFLGWCFETALVSIEEKRFVNRGFIRSPFLPIYGFGAITMIVSGTPVIKDPVLVFIFGAVSATILEFVTGWLLEVIFKTRYWDYSDTLYNFKGRICAEATLMWGFMTLLVNYKVHQLYQSSLFSKSLSANEIALKLLKENAKARPKHTNLFFIYQRTSYKKCINLTPNHTV